jgi:hypothetical protein
MDDVIQDTAEKVANVLGHINVEWESDGGQLRGVCAECSAKGTVWLNQPDTPFHLVGGLFSTPCEWGP